MDTGPLTIKRMETIDDEVTERALRFIDETHKAGSPFKLSCVTSSGFIGRRGRKRRDVRSPSDC